MLEILTVSPGSIADDLGLRPGELLLKVNGTPVDDLVDFLVEEAVGSLQVEIRTVDGSTRIVAAELAEGESFGISLPHPEPDQCGNNCIFCFVHQLPRGMRKSLYIKDEDYRFSYLYGAYVTLTNFTEQGLQRVLDKRLSPLYVSVHAADNELRQKLLGKRSRDILPLLRRLVDGGIEIHTQVVVCPGINDGAHLERTYRELAAMAPGIRTLAIVPVGLTGHRRGLPELRTYTGTEAAALVDWVEARQQESFDRLGSRFLFAADELYLKARRAFPPLAAYEELAQLENGVGLVPLFRAQAAEVLAGAKPLSLPPISLVTGSSAAAEIGNFAAELAEKCCLDLRVHAVENRFFGGEVTVAGLLTGRDILSQLDGEQLGEVLLVPDVMLRDGEDVFLDDMTVDQLAEGLGVQIEPVTADPWGVWDMLDTLSVEREGADNGSGGINS